MPQRSPFPPFGLRRLALVSFAAAAVLAFPAASLRAQAVVAADSHSGRILIDQKGSQRRPVDGFASVATAMVALDWSQRVSMDLGMLATVPQGAVVGIYTNPMGLQPGDRISFRDLLYSILLGADDAACMTLAANVGQDLLNRRQKGGDPVREFVIEMNNLAAKLGATSTSFRTPHGSPPGGRGNGGVTCARDLARLAIYAMSNSSFRFYSMQSSRVVSISRGGQSLHFKINNYNTYVGRNGIDGVKVVSQGQGGPGAILTSKRSHEVTQMIDGRTQLYPRRVVAVVFAPEPVGSAWQALAAGWQEFDRWSLTGRPYDRRMCILPPSGR